MTGSVNQKGEIQAIGGVTHKIEGFFDLCRKRGLTGTQGVIIPVSNVKDLVLKDEVVQAVKDGKADVAIGDRSVIGAGAVVTRDIPADSVAVGNPARVIRTLTRQDETE